jgi:arginase family enzyme
MPTVLRTGPYRIYFYSHEPNEPPHVHIDRDALSAKFWLNPVSIARNFGFSSRELRQIEELVRTHGAEFLEAWNEYFGVGG